MVAEQGGVAPDDGAGGQVQSGGIGQQVPAHLAAERDGTGQHPQVDVAFAVHLHRGAREPQIAFGPSADVEFLPDQEGFFREHIAGGGGQGVGAVGGLDPERLRGGRRQQRRQQPCLDRADSHGEAASETMRCPLRMSRTRTAAPAAIHSPPSASTS